MHYAFRNLCDAIPLNMTQPPISHNLKTLRQTRLNTGVMNAKTEDGIRDCFNEFYKKLLTIEQLFNYNINIVEQSLN